MIYFVIAHIKALILKIDKRKVIYLFFLCFVCLSTQAFSVILQSVSALEPSPMLAFLLLSSFNIDCLLLFELLPNG